MIYAVNTVIYDEYLQNILSLLFYQLHEQGGKFGLDCLKVSLKPYDCQILTFSNENFSIRPMFYSLVTLFSLPSPLPLTGFAVIFLPNLHNLQLQHLHDNLKLERISHLSQSVNHILPISIPNSCVAGPSLDAQMLERNQTNEDKKERECRLMLLIHSSPKEILSCQLQKTCKKKLKQEEEEGFLKFFTKRFLKLRYIPRQLQQLVSVCFSSGFHFV